MNIIKQLKENYRKGYFSVVEREDGYKKIFTFKYKDRFHCSYWEEPEEECKEYFGSYYFFDEITEEPEEDNWKIIDTIHPSKLMGEGWKVGDRCLCEGKEWEITQLGSHYDANDVKLDDFGLVNISEIKPIIEEEEEHGMIDDNRLKALEKRIKQLEKKIK